MELLVIGAGSVVPFGTSDLQDWKLATEGAGMNDAVATGPHKYPFNARVLMCCGNGYELLPPVVLSLKTA